jgi:ferric-dicitrate binding protein FerR (iron transport regulator)
MKDNSVINDIIIKAISEEELTTDEQIELNEWLNDEGNHELFNNLKDKDYLHERLMAAHAIQVDEDKKILDKKIAHRAKVIDRRKRMMWFSYVAAALVVLMIGGYLLLQNKKPQTIAKTEQKPVVTDKAPGKNGAILKLANGQEIVLDNAANGSLTKQGSASITKDGNLLAYNDKGQRNNEVLYNTLRTPVGRQFQLVLPDGTKAWLNSASSITYPTSFTGNERDVTVSGEIYLEVAKDAKKPFKAHVTSPVKGMEETIVEVLGTHFNINSYGDETPVKTTLLEGKVKVSEGNAVAVLKPGQQAAVGNSAINVQSDVDVDKETAWKNGLFDFKNDKLKLIMPQIARWYDVDVVYEGSDVQNISITGKIERAANLSEVLKILSYLKIGYQIDGRKLILKDQH